MPIWKSLIAVSVLAAAPMPATAQAPEASESALYCMRVEPHTGSRLETIECWTRAEWADGGVDVDQDWAEEGVRVIEPAA